MRTLIVDDERIEREGIKLLLKRFRFDVSVREAKNGREALASLKERPADILLTDIKMPIMDGLALLEHLRNSTHRPRVIIFTAYDDFAYAKRAIEYGVVSYLLKPIDPGEFRAAVSRALALGDTTVATAPAMRTELERFLIDALLRATVGAEERIEAEARRLGWDIGKQGRALLLIDAPEGLPANAGREFARDVRNAIGVPCEYLGVSTTRVVVLMRIAAADATTERFRRIGERVLAKLPEGPALVFARHADRMGSLADVYREAEKVLERRFFNPGNRCIVVEEAPPPPAEFAVEDVAAELHAALRLGDHDRASGSLDRLFDLLTRGDLPVTYGKFLASDIVKELARSAAAGEGPDMSSAVEQIARAGSAPELRTFLADLIARDRQRRTNPEATRRLTRRCLAMIEAEYAENLSLTGIARKLEVSPSHLSHLFRRETGKPLIRYLNLVRLEKAAALLRTTPRSIAEVGRSVGFANPSYFSLLFRRHYGITPAAFREMP